MKRPFASKRPIGPLAEDIINRELGFIGPGESDDTVQKAREDIFKAYNNTPEWTKEANSCVDWLKNNLEVELNEVLNKAQSTGDEYTFSVCHNGEDSVVSQMGGGGQHTAPSVSCASGSWKVVNVHTHPKDSPIYPSVTDLRTVIHSGKTLIPAHLNEVIIRADGRGSCLNVYDYKARVDVLETWKAIDASNESRRESSKEIQKLVQQYGTEFSV